MAMYVSSYTPTLAALIRARRRPNPPNADSVPKLLVVAQANTPNLRPIPNVTNEMATIIKYAPQADILADGQGTRAAVLQGIANHRWVHFACHGSQGQASPFLSHFSVYDGAVTLLDLIRADLPHAEVAILSACHTARVSEGLPDEFLHPAGAMLFTGFRSVVGTMWALDDRVGPTLAKVLYKQMWGRKAEPEDASHLARALAKVAIKLDGLEGENKVSFVQLINLVHFGI